MLLIFTQMLGDPELVIRQLAAFGLRELAERGVADSAALQRLMASAEDADASVRTNVVATMGSYADAGIFDPRCLAVIAKLAIAPEDDLAQNLMNTASSYARRGLTDQRILEYLLSAAEAGNLEVRIAALGTLATYAEAGLDTKSMRQLADSSLSDPSDSVRLAADEFARAIVRQLAAARGAWKSIPIPVESGSHWERRVSAFGLVLGTESSEGDGGVVPELILLTEDADPVLRAMGCSGLAMIANRGTGDALTVEKMIVRLSDSSPNVRNDAAFVVGAHIDLGVLDSRVIPGLKALLVDPIPKVRIPAALALEQLAAKSVGQGGGVPCLVNLLSGPDGLVRERAARALSELASESRLEPSQLSAIVKAAMNSTQGEVRMRTYLTQVIGGLARSGATERDSLPFLIACLGSTDPEGRAAATITFDIMGRMGIKCAEALMPLGRRLADPSEEAETRSSAANAIGLLAESKKVDPRVLECLIHGLVDRTNNIMGPALASVGMLSEINVVDRRVLAYVAPLLLHASADTRHDALVVAIVYARNGLTDPAFLPSIKRNLGDPDQGVNDRATEALAAYRKLGFP